jgi:hypothetical protein
MRWQMKMLSRIMRDQNKKKRKETEGPKPKSNFAEK